MAGISPAQIRAARAMLNLKQSELSNAAGISLATLNNIERGLGDPRSSTLLAIEKALNQGGISCDKEHGEESVRLSLQARPAFYESYHASEFIFDYLRPHSLLLPQRILFFCRKSSDSQAKDSFKLCLLIDGKVRYVLFDHAALTLNTIGKAAEVAGILLATLIRHKGQCFYLDHILEDTTLVGLSEVIDGLKQENWLPLDNPTLLLDQIRNYDDLLKECSMHDHHPLFQLLDRMDIPYDLESLRASIEADKLPVSHDDSSQTTENPNRSSILDR